MKPSPFRVFRNPSFSLLALGSFASLLGSQMQVVGISWHMYSLTHSAFNLGLIGLAGFLPILLLSPFGGLLVDYFNRKKLIICNQAIYGFLALGFGILTHLGLASGLLMYVLLFLMGLVTVVDLPARQAIIPSLVPKEELLQGFNSMTIVRQIATLIGPAIGGFLIAVSGVEIIYILNGISFFLFLITLFFINIPAHPGEKEVPMSLEAVKEGIAFVIHSPILASTMILDFFATFFAAATVIFPIFALDVLHIGAKGVGFLYAAPSVGAVITGLVLGHIHIQKQGKAIVWAVMIYSVATIGFGLSRWFILSLLFLAISGGADMVSMAIRRTVSQLITPPHMRGRMNAINMMFFTGGPFLGETEAGFAAGLLGAPLSVVIGGAGALVAVIAIAYFVGSLRNYQEEGNN